MAIHCSFIESSWPLANDGEESISNSEYEAILYNIIFVDLFLFLLNMRV